MKVEEEGGFIADTFFGHLQSYIHYKNKNGEEKFQEVRESFADVLLNALSTKDLYEAWENMYQDLIDGYKTPEVRMIAIDSLTLYRTKQLKP
jgi:hypothetical protein